MNNRVILSLLLVLTVMIITGCGKPGESSVEERARRAKIADKSTDDIVIGIAWKKNTPFLEGIELAIKQINNKGGVNGRKIRIIVDDRIGEAKTTRQKLKLVRQVANSFASNLDMVAVIGHRYSSVAIPASITYEKQGLVFIAPTSTNLALTTHNFKFVFRMLPNNEKMGNQIASYCHDNGYQKMAVLNDWNPYGEELAASFIKNAVEKPNNIQIVFHRSFFPDKTDFLEMMAELKKREFDAVFLSGSPETSGRLIQQSREMGIKKPFFGGDSLEFLELLKPSDSLTLEEVNLIKEAAKGTVVPTVFNEDIISLAKYFNQLLKEHGLEFNQTVLNQLKTELAEKSEISEENLVLLEILEEYLNKIQQFIEDFRKEYGKYPHRLAALGYDSIYLLTDAMKKVQSTVPIQVATHLRYMSEPWAGVTGAHIFEEDGDIKNKKFYFKKLENGKFQFMLSAHQLEINEIIMQIKKLSQTGR
jgi:branched-chain amino acid transport system substrate-binding protein